MIKKAVLLTAIAPFLMVFSVDALAWTYWHVSNRDRPIVVGKINASVNGGSSSVFKITSEIDGLNRRVYFAYHKPITELEPDDYLEDLYNVSLSDEQCNQKDGDQVKMNPDTYNYLASGGSIKTNGGACSVSAPGGVGMQMGDGDWMVSVDSVSSGDPIIPYVGIDGGLGGELTEGTFSVIDFNVPDYLSPVPGECTASSCVNIAGENYLVDWDTAPSHYEYVDSSGNVQTNPNSSGGGGDTGGGDTGGGDTGGGDTSGGDTSGGDTGGGDTGGGDTGGGDTGGGDTGSGDTGGGDTGGGDTGGGDTGSGDTGGGGSGITDPVDVPDFEFDESGIIEAVGSSGQSVQGAVSALSTQVTQSGADTVGAIDNQTDTLTGTLTGLKDSIIDSIQGGVTSLVEGLSSSFDEKLEGLVDPEGMPTDAETQGMLDGDGVTDSTLSDLENSYGDVKDGFTDDYQDIFSGSGLLADALGGMKNFVTSFLPQVPSGSCTPIHYNFPQASFSIDCQGFNLLKSALSWILFFFTAYQLISLPMESRKSQ